MPDFRFKLRRARAAVMAAAVFGTLALPAAAAPAAEHTLSRVAQIGLSTDDLERAIHFYRGVLGLELMFVVSDMAFFAVGDTRLMVGLSRGASMVPGGGSVVYFDAQDWAETEAALLARGLTFDRPTEILQRDGAREHVLREFHDPDGNLLAIIGWRATAQ